MRKFILLACVVLGIPAPGMAQTVSRPFDEVGRYLEPGDRIYVVGREAGELGGTLERLSASSLVIRVDGKERALAANEVGSLERFPDPIWNETLRAALTGYAVGIGSNYILCRSFGGEGACRGVMTSGYTQRSAVTMAGLFAGIGLLADVSHRERSLVYGTKPGDARRQLRTPAPVGSLGDLWSRVRPGDTVYLRRRDGEDIRGTFFRASASEITLLIDAQLREIPSADVQEVRRRTGQLGRAMFLGTAAGAAMGVLHSSDGGSRGRSAMTGVVLGWLAGATVGPHLPGRTLVYGEARGSSTRLEPLVAHGGGGLAVSMRF